MKKFKLQAILSLMLVMLLAFTACGEAKEKTDENKGPEEQTEANNEADKAENTENEEANNTELKPIKIVLDYVPNTNHTGLYCAKEMGLFEKAGYDVDIMQPPEGSTTQLIGNGGAEFGISFQDFLAPNFASENPMPVTAVAAILQHNTSGIVSLKESGIKSPKDMADKKYSTWDLDIEKAIIKKMMEDDGGDYAKLKFVPYAENLVAFLQDKENGADCAWIYYAWDGIKLELEGMEPEFLAVKDYLPSADYYTPVIIANNDWLKENPEDAKKILAAISEGYEFAAENPEEAAKHLLKNAPELTEELAIASQKWISKEYISDAKQFGYIDPERWNAFYKLLNDEKLVENEIPADFGFSNEYLPEK